jgi:acetyl-CoA acetyltransferase
LYQPPGDEPQEVRFHTSLVDALEAHFVHDEVTPVVVAGVVKPVHQKVVSVSGPEFVQDELEEAASVVEGSEVVTFASSEGSEESSDDGEGIVEESRSGSGSEESSDNELVVKQGVKRYGGVSCSFKPTAYESSGAETSSKDSSLALDLSAAGTSSKVTTKIRKSRLMSDETLVDDTSTPDGNRYTHEVATSTPLSTSNKIKYVNKNSKKSERLLLMIN